MNNKDSSIETINEFLSKWWFDNEYKQPRKITEDKLFEDVHGVVNFCYNALDEVIQKYRIMQGVSQDNIEKIIINDVEMLSLQMFRPHISNDETLNYKIRKLNKRGEKLKTDYGVICETGENPDLYSSVIIYLEDFVINLSM